MCIYIYDLGSVHNLYLPYGYGKGAWHWSSAAFLHPRSQLVLFIMLFICMLHCSFLRTTSSHTSSQLWLSFLGLHCSLFFLLSVHPYPVLSLPFPFTTLGRGSAEPCTSPMYVLVGTTVTFSPFLSFSDKNCIVLWLIPGRISSLSSYLSVIFTSVAVPLPWPLLSGCI